MIHAVLSILLIVVGIVLALTLAAAALKVIGYILLAAGIVWLLSWIFNRNKTTATR